VDSNSEIVSGLHQPSSSSSTSSTSLAAAEAAATKTVTAAVFIQFSMVPCLSAA